jgi:amino-acid N-acetyltransferase
VRSLAVREEKAGKGIGRAIVERLFSWAGERGFVEVLALTRRVPFFESLGFHVTRRERFLEKLATDCQACPLNLCCDETAVVRPVVPGDDPEKAGESRARLAMPEGALRK